MKISIKYESVLDHEDILINESKKSLQLINLLQCAFDETVIEDPVQALQIKKIVSQVESLQRNILRRKKLLLEIVFILKEAGFFMDNTVSEIESNIKKMSEGGQNE